MLRKIALGIACLTLTFACSDNFRDTKRTDKTDRTTELAKNPELSTLEADAAYGKSGKGEDKGGKGSPTKSDNPGQSDDPSQSGRVDDKMDYSKLETGLYWFGSGGRFQKADSTRPSSYYNPAKPTLIYVHGWQFNSIAVNFYETTVRTVVSNEPIDLAKAWIDQGWNVGIFQWTQFADDELGLVERKIWDASVMTWLAKDGVRRPFAAKLSASELFHQAYLLAMKDQKNPEIRLAGHSLGSQMASILSKRLTDDAVAGRLKKELLPKRVILMDPFMTGGPKDYLQAQANSAVMASYAREYTEKGSMSLEIYRTSLLSLLPQADPHLDLISLSAFRNVANDSLYKPDDQAGKHGYAVSYYLWSMAFKNYVSAAAAPEADPALPKTCISAVSSQSEIQALMRSRQQQKSTDNLTREPNDDPCTWEPKGSL